MPRSAREDIVGQSGVTLSGYADRVDLLAGGMADILTTRPASPSKAQAHAAGAATGAEARC